MSWQQAGRFALGTLTRIPVPPPTRLDSRTAARGVALAPLVGCLLGLGSGLPLLARGAPLLAAALAVSLAAYLTRALHWDGLADTADGLGSGQPAGAALQIMRRSDIGPFGTLTLVLTVLLQVAALVSLPPGARPAGWVGALVAARCGLVLGCYRGRPARADGLGKLVIGVVTARQLAGATLTTAAICALATHWVSPLAVLGAWLAAAAWSALVIRVSARRLGGATGDVLGAIIEGATAASLVAMAALP